MDFECPAVSRVAGQTSFDSGILFNFTAMWRTFKLGNSNLPNLTTLGGLGAAVDDGSTGLRSYRHSADGDGR